MTNYTTKIFQNNLLLLFIRFYVGKVATGLLQMFTLGGFGVWTVIDFIMIIIGDFTDDNGNCIDDWT